MNKSNQTAAFLYILLVILTVILYIAHITDDKLLTPTYVFPLILALWLWDKYIVPSFVLSQRLIQTGTFQNILRFVLGAMLFNLIYIIYFQRQNPYYLYPATPIILFGVIISCL